MRRTRLVTIIIFLSVLFMMLVPKSYAADESFELELETSTTTVNQGDSFSVNIIIDNMNITSGDQGIGAYQAKIIYDTNILQLVNVTPATGWEVSENEGNMVANTSDAEVVKKRTHTATINFKVLNNATFGNTIISLENIQGSSGTTTIDGIGIQKTINIVEKSDPSIDDDNPSTDDDNPSVDDDNPPTEDDNPSTGTNNNPAEGGTTSKNQIGAASNINQSATSNKVLPYAGIRNAIIIGIGIAIVVAVVFYIKYSRAV